MRNINALIGVICVTAVTQAFADYGALALRIRCTMDSDQIELEPFIAWNEGEPPYEAYGADDANMAGVQKIDDSWFYSYRFSKRDFISARCFAKNRRLRIFVTEQKELIAIEAGFAVIDAVPVGDTWDNWDAIYILRSAHTGAWEECYGPKSDGYEKLKCMKFDPANPNSRFLSNKSLEADARGRARPQR